jgi:hypothetical protein
MSMARAPNLSGNPPKILDGGRTRLRAQWRELFKTFDAVICAVKPTPAYPHDHSPEQEKRRIDGKEYVYPDSARLARNRDIARLAVNRDFRPASCRTDCRSACRSSGPGWRIARR